MMKVNHLLIPYLTLLAFIFGGVLSSGGVEWYAGLALPSWHPSIAAISLIWAVIYVALAWALLIVWNRFPRDRAFKSLLLGLSACGLLNLAWSAAFFYFHAFAASVALALVLGALGTFVAVRISGRSPKAALLMIPYIVWVFFAAYLNYVVGALNG